MWESILAALAALSAEPSAVADAHPRAAAAVAAARSTMAVEAPPAPAPKPAPKPKPGCPDGKCVSGASPATVSPAKP
jgi:hypothetical protein